MDLSKVVAVISGGASGLGAACAKRIVSLGGSVAILDLQQEKGIELVQTIGMNNALYVKTDVTNEVSVQNALQEVEDKYGSCNVVINCAGIAIAKKLIGRGNLHELELFQKVININVNGTLIVTKFAVDQMIRKGEILGEERGVVINTSSVAAFDGQIGQVAYSASKGAIASMTLPLARELASKQIRVMAIAPGVFETPMMAGLPEKAQKSLGESVPFPSRLGKPDEYALLACSIIENTMLNGEVIRLDGALRMS